EQRERTLRALPRVLEAWARHVHFGVIDQTERLQVHVADPLGEGATLPEVAVRGVEPLPVRAHHAEVVVSDRTPVLVPALTVRRQRALIARQGLAQLALNVGDDPQVLLHPRAQPTARATQLQRPHECLAGARSRRLEPPSSSARTNVLRASSREPAV